MEIEPDVIVITYRARLTGQARPSGRGGRSRSSLLTRDATLQIAVNIAKLPELLLKTKS